MPHKRAKRSVRVQDGVKRGSDNPPPKDSLSNEAIPKSMARVLNAARVREDFKAKKRKLADDPTDAQPGKSKKAKRTSSEGDKEQGGGGEKLKIKPGESLAHFNKRVENDLRPLMREASKSSFATTRKSSKLIPEPTKTPVKGKSKATTHPTASSDVDSDSEQAHPPAKSKHADRPKEFQTGSTSAPRRLNDIAQAPPELKRLPRGAKKLGVGASGKSDGIVSMAQKQMMEVERENAIRRYREMRAGQRNDGAQVETNE